MILLKASRQPVALELHESLWDGLCSDALRRESREVTTLGLTESDHLSVWAAQCENPQGQRATLARVVSGLIRFADVLSVERQLAGPAQGFWERVG